MKNKNAYLIANLIIIFMALAVFLFQTKSGIITMTEASTGLSLRRLILMYGILIFLISKVTMIYRLTEMR